MTDASGPGAGTGANGDAGRARDDGPDDAACRHDLDRDGEVPATDAAPGPDERVGVPIPDEHLGAFVAQAFEDPERDTDWADAVEGMVADDARAAWERLDPPEQVAEVLRMADRFDERAVEALGAIPTGGDAAGVEARFDDALRCRRNADILRDGIADAYATGHVDDEGLVAAVEAAGFDTSTIAEREDRLETVAGAHDLDFRPYGGTLFDAADGAGAGTDDGEFTAWEP